MKTTIKILMAIGVMFVCIKMLLLTKSCNSQELFNDTTDIARIVNTTTDTLLFNMSNISDITYYPDDDLTYIKYDDPDVFDYQHLAYITGRDTWYGDYIILDIEDSLVDELKSDKYNYYNTKDYWLKDEINSKYRIIEYLITFQDDTVDLIYEVIKI